MHSVGVASYGLQLEERTFMCCLQETGLYEYKVYGVLTTCTPELCADVYMDLTYRKDWDGYVKGKKTETAQEGRVHTTFTVFLLSLCLLRSFSLH